MLTLTQEAKLRINEVCTDGKFLRISLSSGGCHGFSYKFVFDTKINEDDLIIQDYVLINKLFAEKLKNPVLDFKKNISSSYFVLESANFDTKCGCGSSFSLKV
jgi:iron-sulfur cluster assembly accessory protein